MIEIDLQHAAADVEAPDAERLRPWIESVIARHPGTGPAELCLRVVGEEESAELNRVYRGRNRPTNVLSFAAGEEAQPPAGPRFLGDIVICGPVVVREAADQGKRLEHHWAHLLVHGTLHLLGYDHATDAEADTMEALETQILGEHGIADPYAA